MRKGLVGAGLALTFMEINEIIRVPHPSRRSRVGADSSRPPPIYRPLRDGQSILLKFINDWLPCQLSAPLKKSYRGCCNPLPYSLDPCHKTQAVQTSY